MTSQAPAPPADEAVASRGRLFGMGALTGLAGLATSQLLTALLGQAQSPVVAVAEAVRDITPGSVAVPLIHVVKHLDKPLLVAGSVLGLLALAGVAGTQTRRRPWLAYLIFAAMAALGLAAVLTRPNSGPYSFLPLAVGAVTWFVVLSWLGSPRRHLAQRRAFLRQTGLAALGSVAVIGLGTLLGRGRSRVEEARSLLRLPATRGIVPDGADFDISPYRWRTGNAGFYQVHTAITLPTITPADWSLRIHGLVDHPLTISYDELVQRKLTEEWVTLCCVSNEVGGDLIGNAHWSGILVRDLLEEAGVRAGADAVKQTSDDGWTCGTPLSALTDPDRNAILAVAMNGKPLPIEHGFPVRMVVPGLYGYVSATKWLVDLEVTRFTDFSAYWSERGWSVKGPVKTESRIEVPGAGDQVKVGRVRFGGTAWAQHTGIEKVEVQLDGGPWRPAELGRVPNDDTWAQWAVSATVGKGKHQLAVRATDKSGYTQTSARAGVLPNGATGWHTIDFSAG